MKGLFFSKPLELSLEIKGESWHQGDIVTGSLTIKNHSNQEVDLSGFGTYLVFADIKKVSDKDNESFTYLEESLFPASKKIKASGQEELLFEFKLAQDCFITDKKSSLYLLCGHKESAQIVGNLQLEIKPVKIISDYLQIFTDMFRFKVKGYKNKKNTIEIEMTKPDMKEFTSIQQLKLLMKLNQQNIEIKYCFKLKKMSFDKSNPLKAEDVTLELPQTLTPANYKIYGEALNQAGITKCIDEILAQVRVKSFV